MPPLLATPHSAVTHTLNSGHLYVDMSGTFPGSKIPSVERPGFFQRVHHRESCLAPPFFEPAQFHSRMTSLCGSAQCKAVDGVRSVREVRRRSTKMVSTVRVVPVSLNLCSRNENEFSILSPLGVDVAVGVFYFSGIAVCIIAAAGGWIVRHVPI
jgi:hypothetical protein